MRGVAALGALIALTAAVVVGALASLDRALLDFVQQPQASWLDVAASAVTIFGQSEVVGTVALAVAVVRLRARRHDWWIPLLVALVVAIELALKLTVPQTPPPEEILRSVHLPSIEGPATFSFPSGHVARVAFLVAALRWPNGISAAVVLTMALTLIYLGEHWPSDVLGGWFLGYGIAAIARSFPKS